MKITILGTSGSIFTSTRDPVSILIDDAILLDCAEGTTKKLLNLKKINQLETICISHVHPDHFMGLTTLFWQLWLGERRTSPLTVYGPQGISNTMTTLFKITHTPIDDFRYSINFHEFMGDSIEQVSNISALKVSHGMPALAFRIDNLCETMAIDRRGHCFIHGDAVAVCHCPGMLEEGE